MVKEVQFRRGSTSQHSTFIGAAGEITINTDRNVPVIHNGITTSGFEIVGIGATQVVTNKTILVATASSTGTASQPLQVSGGAYVSGNLGIGTTTPSSSLFVQGTSQFVGVLTANGAINFNTTASNITIGGQTSGLLTLGGISQTATQTLGLSTVTHILGIGTGASGINTVKTINLGTGGLSGSFTLINVGSTSGLSTIVINNGSTLLIGSATSTGTASQKLQVTGGAYVSGSVGLGTTNPVGQLQVSNGPVIVGAATSTGTASQPLQVTGGAYVSGNLGVGVTNTSQKFEVAGGGVRFTQFGQGDITITHSNLLSTIKSAGTVQLALGANNNEVIRINNSGNVGLGTTNPVGQLQVSNGPVIVGAATSTETASQNLQVTGGAYISDSVGIGTTNPPDKLTVSGKIQIQQDSSSNNRLVFRGQPGSSYRWNIDNNGSSNDFRIFREDDNTAANGSIPFNISSAGNILINGVNSTGTASQQLQVNSGAYFASNVGIASTNPTADLHIVGPGTSTAGSAPIKVSVASTFMLATSEADAIEYDNLNLYHTPNDTTNGSGRTIIPGIQFVRRTSDLSINDQLTPGTSVFGATTRPALLAGTIYEVDAVLFVTKVTSSGTLTLQLSLSTGNFTFATLHMPTLSSGQHIIAGTTSPVSFPATASLTASLSYAVHIKGLIQPASNSRLDLLAFSSTATITALTNSYLKVSCMGRGNNIGNIG